MRTDRPQTVHLSSPVQALYSPGSIWYPSPSGPSPSPPLATSACHPCLVGQFSHLALAFTQPLSALSSTLKRVTDCASVSSPHSSRAPCVVPLVARAVHRAPHPCCGRAPRRTCHVLCPSSRAPCVAPVTCAVVVHLITRPVCRALRRPCCVSCPSPMLWSCTSLHALCVVPLVVHAVRRACHLCRGHAPCRACRVLHPSLPMLCAVPIAHVMCRACCPPVACAVLCTLSRAPCVAALVACAVCHGPHRAC